MSSGERPIGAAKGKQPNTEALCQPPPPPRGCQGKGFTALTHWDTRGGIPVMCTRLMPRVVAVQEPGRNNHLQLLVQKLQAALSQEVPPSQTVLPLLRVRHGDMGRPRGLGGRPGPFVRGWHWVSEDSAANAPAEDCREVCRFGVR